ncbi:GBP family porin [Paraburkholderia atlantica]|uniref:porin n=1 Tax=Paraburkholderia atlantica TaxID=2654982 RepID=UPI00128BB157|nr:porin [Paraburkholderia atlantica]MPW10895.1 porin [Paraburkholderia atlantica]
MNSKSPNAVLRRGAALASLAALLFGAQAAHAQSSVTLYGIISTGVGWVSNVGGSSSVQMIAGTMQNNRWGLRGVEDLGGGLNAIFVLENGFDITNGKFQQGGRMFGRQAYVGLSDKSWGTVTLGRQYDIPFDYLDRFEAPVAALGLSAHIGDNDNLFGSYRYNNSIKYQSPTVNGLRGSVMYAMSNAAGQWAVNRSVSAGVAYDNGPLKLALVGLNTNYPGPTLNPNGAVTDDYVGPPFLLFHTSPINRNAGVSRQREFGGGAQYTFSKLRLTGLVTDVRYDYLDHTSLHLDNFDVNATYDITPFLVLGAAYVYTKGQYGGGIDAAPHWNMGQISINYLLSKRTNVYVFTNYQRATDAKAVTYLLAPSSNGSQTVVVAGIRHLF